MYNGVGVYTPRGTGTNGYVSKNFASVPKGRRNDDANFVKPLKVTKPNQEMLELEYKKRIEVELLEWVEREGIEEKGYVSPAPLPN